MPKNLPTNFSGVGHVAKNWQCKLLKRPLGADNPLEQRYDSIESGFLLPRLAQSAEVVHGVQNLVGNFLG